MRSDQIYQALAHGINRFEVCQLVSKGVKATHKSGSRFEDSINFVLDCVGACEKAPTSSPQTTAQTEAKKSLQPAA